MNKHLHISPKTGTVMELADMQVLETCVERHLGSSPSSPTKYVSVGVKIDEVSCNSICNRADEVAMEKKLVAVGLRNNQSTILRKYCVHYHLCNSAGYSYNPSSILAFSNNVTSAIFLQLLQLVYCKYSLVK